MAFVLSVVSGIILDQTAVGVRDVLVRMVEENNRNNSESRIILDHVLTTIDMDDSYKLSTTSECTATLSAVCREGGEILWGIPPLRVRVCVCVCMCV